MRTGSRDIWKAFWAMEKGATVTLLEQQLNDLNANLQIGRR